MWLRSLALVSLMSSLVLAGPGNVTLPRFPAISPEGKHVTFTWRGDLWKVPAEGGQATRLTANRFNDLRSAWSPDGSHIVFNSDRKGYRNLFRIEPDGTALEQVTVTDRWCRHPGFATGPEGEPRITFSGFHEGSVYREQRCYYVSPEGGQIRRLHDGFGSRPRVSPNGRRVAFTRGAYYHDWARDAYHGSDAMNVWVHDSADDNFTQITDTDVDEGSARWLDNETLLFMSDRGDGATNLYRAELEGKTPTFQRLTDFQERGVESFDVASDATRVVLHRWDALYTLDLADSDNEPQPIRIIASEDDQADHQLKRIDREVDEARLSPDGKVMAYIAYGRVYVRNIEKKSSSRLVTPDTHARHQHLAWSPSGDKLYFASDREGTWSIYQATVSLTRSDVKNGAAAAATDDGGDNSATGNHTDAPATNAASTAPATQPATQAATQPTETVATAPQTAPATQLDKRDPERWHDAIRFNISPVVTGQKAARDPSPSPNGKWLTYRRGRGTLMLHNLDNGKRRVLVEGWDARLHWRWGPHSRYIAYAQNNMDFSSNIFIVPVEGGREPVNITRHPRNDLRPRWSADGRILSFISNRVGDNYDVWQVYLDDELEGYTPKELSEYYDEAAKEADKRKPLPIERKADTQPAETKPPELELKSAWRRLRRVTSLPGDEWSNAMTPSGDRLIFSAELGDRDLYSVSWDGTGRRRLGNSADVQQVSLTGDKVVYVRSGRAGTVKPDGGDDQSVPLSDEIRLDLAKQARQKYRDATSMLARQFYRPDMNGVDWKTVTKRYAKLAYRTRTANEFDYVMDRLIGELSASHLGFGGRGPSSPLRQASGRLGIVAERMNRDDAGDAYEVHRVLPQSPAAKAGKPLQPGDRITAIELEPFGRRDTLLSALRGKVNEEVIVSFERPSEDGKAEQMRTLLTPVSYGDLTDLRYKAYIEKRRDLVSEWSDGRIGYIHIEAMNTSSLHKYERDLYAAAHGKDGLIIDVRNNGGGSTADRILASIMAPEHAYTIPRGADRDDKGHYPQNRLFIQRYTLPINMLCNGKTHSNAEILSHAFKTLDRGRLIGQPTYGGVISTGSYDLIDGATISRPFRGWYLPDDTDMEGNGAVPHIAVPRGPGDEAAGRYPQLRKAVENLMTRAVNKGEEQAHEAATDSGKPASSD